MKLPCMPEISLEEEQCLLKRIDLMAGASTNFMKIVPTLDALSAADMRADHSVFA